MSKTKINFALSFIDLLNTKEIKDVTISSLCQHSNYSRETFYYHFKDKYDLISWMHAYEKHSYFNKYYGKEGFSYTVGKILADMKKIKIFYFRGFEDNLNTQLETIMTTQTIELYTQLAKHNLDQSTLSKEIELSINYSVYGAVLLAKEWLLSENDLNEIELAQFIAASMNDNLKDILLSPQIA